MFLGGDLLFNDIVVVIAACWVGGVGFIRVVGCFDSLFVPFDDGV